MFFLNNASIFILGLPKPLFQDGWIGILMCLGIEMIILVFYWVLIIKHPHSDLSMIIKNTFGKSIGKIIVLIYAGYFIYIAYRVMEDLYYLLDITLLLNTPKYAIYLAALPVLIYCINLGVDALGRISVIMFSFIMIAFVLEVFGHFTTATDVNNFTPILERGWAPILEWSSTQFMVLFGEIVVVLVYFKNVKDTKKAMKFVYLTVIINAIIMVLFFCVDTLTLDPVLAEITTYPIMIIAQLILVPFLEKIDVIIFALIIFISFMKVLVLFYASSALTVSVFKKANKLLVNIFLGIIIFMFAMFSNQSILRFFDVGLEIVPIYLHFPLQIGIPILMVVLSLFKRFPKNKEESK